MALVLCHSAIKGCQVSISLHAYSPFFTFERNLATFPPLSTFVMESQEALSLSDLILAGFYESAEQSESQSPVYLAGLCRKRKAQTNSRALASRAHSTRCVCVCVSPSKSGGQCNPCELPSSSPMSITQNPIYSEQLALPCFCSCQNWLLRLDCLCPSLALRPVNDG